MNRAIPLHKLDLLKSELEELDNAYIEIEGKQIKASKCYYFGTSPAHILYNTNCPETLRQQIELILAKYSSGE